MGLIYCLFNWAFHLLNTHSLHKLVLSSLYSAVLRMHSSGCDLRQVCKSLYRLGRQTSSVNIEACRITTVSISVLTSSPRLKYLVAAVSPLPRGSRNTESVQNRQLIYGLKSFASFPPATWKFCVVHVFP